MGPEREVGHEKLIDYTFRVPSVEGMGTGREFQLKNLTLPLDCEKLIEQRSGASKFLYRMLETDCRHFSLPQGFIEFKDKILSQIVFGGLGESSRLFFDENCYCDNGVTGAYQFENVRDMRMALVLAKAACSYVDLLRPEIDEQCAYVDYVVDNDKTKFFSIDLKIPDDLAKEAKKKDDKFFRERFELKASNIAGRFGLTVNTLNFEKQFLRRICINKEFGCDYGIDQNLTNIYGEHNVDTIQEAFGLHGIASAYINELLEARENSKMH